MRDRQSRDHVKHRLQISREFAPEYRKTVFLDFLFEIWERLGGSHEKGLEAYVMGIISGILKDR